LFVCFTIHGVSENDGRSCWWNKREFLSLFIDVQFTSIFLKMWFHKIQGTAASGGKNGCLRFVTNFIPLVKVKIFCSRLF